MAATGHESDQAVALVQAFANALQALPCCVLITDCQWVVKFANRACALAFGRAESEFTGLRWDDLFPEAPVASSREFSQIWNGDLSGITADGKGLKFFAHRAPLQLPDQPPVASVYYLRELTGSVIERQAVITQRMSTVSTLAAGISHEFNNLLTGILGYTELVAARLGADEVGRGYAAQIRRAASEASGLTRQLGVFSQTALFEVERVDLRETLNDALRMVAATVGPNIRFLNRSSLAPAAVDGDRTQLREALLCLLLNACEAMPGGGPLTTEVESVTLDALLASDLGLGEGGDYLRLTILDEGQGMAEAVRRRAFEPFYSTKEGPHTGLGLSTAFGIIQKHHGAIQLDSAPGRGTAARVFLPAAAVARATPAPTVASRLDAPATVLLVEDEDIPRELQAHVLQTAGYAVLAACDGEQGLQLFREYGEQVQLVVTDIVMPRMSGDRMVAEVRKLGSAVKVLAVSGYSKGDAVERLRALGVDGFVQKPFTGQGLLEHVRHALGERA